MSYKHHLSQLTGSLGPGSSAVWPNTNTTNGPIESLASAPLIYGRYGYQTAFDANAPFRKFGSNGKKKSKSKSRGHKKLNKRKSKRKRKRNVTNNTTSTSYRRQNYKNKNKSKRKNNGYR